MVTRNPYYKTTSAGDYGDVEFNKGGSPAYKDSYIAGGKGSWTWHR